MRSVLETGGCLPNVSDSLSKRIHNSLKCAQNVFGLVNPNTLIVETGVKKGCSIEEIPWVLLEMKGHADLFNFRLVEIKPETLQLPVGCFEILKSILCPRGSINL